MTRLHRTTWLVAVAVSAITACSSAGSGSDAPASSGSTGVPAVETSANSATPPRPTDGTVVETVTSSTVPPRPGGLPAPTTDLVPPEWPLAFADEFDGAELSAKWHTCFWWEVDDAGCRIASNDELQAYRREAVVVRDGQLEMTVTASDQEMVDEVALPYRSGMVSTGRSSSDLAENPLFAFTFGYVEARVRVPSAEGLWPAVWLLSADNESLPEIDILEWYSGRPDIVTMHVRQSIDGEEVAERHELDVTDLPEGWHTFGALWTPSEVVFTMDGTVSARTTDVQLIPTTPMYLILNLAVAERAGHLEPQELPQSFDVDYVRIWMEAGSGG